MGEFGGHYARLNQSDRERQVLYDIIYMWKLKKKEEISEYNKMKQTYRYRE